MPRTSSLSRFGTRFDCPWKDEPQLSHACQREVTSRTPEEAKIFPPPQPDRRRRRIRRDEHGPTTFPKLRTRAFRWAKSCSFSTDVRLFCALPGDPRSTMALSRPGRGPQGTRGKGDWFHNPAVRI